MNEIAEKNRMTVLLGKQEGMRGMVEGERKPMRKRGKNELVGDERSRCFGVGRFTHNGYHKSACPATARRLAAGSN